MATTITKKEIEQIVHELVELDSDFAGQEDELRTIVKRIAISRPMVNPNKAFINRLRREIQAEISDQRSGLGITAPVHRMRWNVQMLGFGATGLVLGVLLAFLGLNVPDISG
ncbi:hypothetical protein GF380_03215, partial [Candidatus Uhrbacteria bacterium]|nr:hypothetical protein [Candidatus Uhrbacteria bacterium]MBD3284152.1 hypothetical protein [Candidatus Uhrbacteria bacterium]